MWSAELSGRASIPHSEFRTPHWVRRRNCSRHREKLPPLHRPGSSRKCGLYYPPSEEAGRRVPDAIRSTDRATHGQAAQGHLRSEEHTSELQSPCNLVCRLLLEKKKRKSITHRS